MTRRGIIAKKIGMTRVVDDQGKMVAVTVLEVVDQRVTKILTPERDGYHGVQLGYYEKPEQRLNRPDVARLRKANVEKSYARFVEFRSDVPLKGMDLGVAVNASALEGAGAVDVSGVTKGHGFEGAITRWGHKTGRRTHGSHFHRRPGSLGQRTTPGRVYKNKEQPGQMGSVQRTVQNLRVYDIDLEGNLMVLKGSIPGHKNSYVLVKQSIKSTKIS